jgi:hypothetical protein
MNGILARSKFRIGDKVRCIGRDEDYGGAGWRPNKSFIVGNITMDSFGQYIYWDKKGIQGVFEPFLASDVDWDD